MVEKTRKPTKVAVVLEQIQNDILSGMLAPNEKLPMEALKKRYGISGSPLREALCRLASNGLVNVEEQCGFYVAPLSMEELYDIYNIRAHIESLALKLAIQNGDDEWEAGILAAWHRFSKYIDPRINKNVEPNKWDELQKEFLYSLVKGCNSPWLLKIRDMMYDQAARYRVVCLHAHHNDESVLLRCLHDDERLMSAVLARDIEEACKLSTANYMGSAKYIADVLKDKQGVTGSRSKHQSKDKSINKTNKTSDHEQHTTTTGSSK